MKKIVLLFMVLFCCSFVLADNIDVSSFKAYVDNIQANVDWEDDTFEATPGKTIETQLRFINNHASEEATIDVTGTLYGIGGDLERKETIKITKGNKGTVVFQYFIPTASKEGIYDLEIKYSYKYPSINYTDVTKTFEIDIRNEPFDYTKALLNITQLLAAEKEKQNKLMEGLYGFGDLALNLSECRAKISEYETQKVLYDEYKAKYDNCTLAVTDSAICEVEKQNLYTLTQVEARESTAAAEARRQQKSSDDGFWNMVLIGGAIIFFMNKRKKQVGGKGEGQSLGGASW